MQHTTSGQANWIHKSSVTLRGAYIWLTASSSKPKPLKLKHCLKCSYFTECPEPITFITIAHWYLMVSSVVNSHVGITVEVSYSMIDRKLLLRKGKLHLVGSFKSNVPHCDRICRSKKGFSNCVRPYWYPCPRCSEIQIFKILFPSVCFGVIWH